MSIPIHLPSGRKIHNLGNPVLAPYGRYRTFMGEPGAWTISGVCILSEGQLQFTGLASLCDRLGAPVCLLRYVNEAVMPFYILHEGGGNRTRIKAEAKP